MSAPSGIITCSRCSIGHITRQTSSQQNPMYGCNFEICSNRSSCGYFRWLTHSSHHPPGWVHCYCGKPCDYFLKKQTFKCYNDSCTFTQKADPKSLVLDHSQCIRCRPLSPLTSAKPSFASPTVGTPACADSPVPTSSFCPRRLFPETNGDASLSSSLSAETPLQILPDFSVPLPIIAWISQPDGASRLFHLAVLAGMEVTFHPSHIGIQWRLPSPIPPQQQTIYSGFSPEMGSSGTEFAPPCFQRLDAGFIPTPFLIDIGKITQSHPVAPWVTYSVPELLPVIKT